MIGKLKSPQPTPLDPIGWREMGGEVQLKMAAATAMQFAADPPEPETVAVAGSYARPTPLHLFEQERPSPLVPQQEPPTIFPGQGKQPEVSIALDWSTIASQSSRLPATPRGSRTHSRLAAARRVVHGEIHADG